MLKGLPMIRQIQYDIDDIEKFLQVHKNSKEHEYSQNLGKLLHVQNKIPIFVGLDPKEIKVIVNNLKFVKYPYKDFVITQGDTSQEIFFILSGECHVFVNKNKVSEISTGTTFGEASAIFGTKRNASVVCSSKEVTLLSFSINHDNLDFCAAALATLYKNLAQQINTKLESMNTNLIKK